MRDPYATDEAVRAIHLLLARCHLAMAGVRRLTQEERSIIKDLDRWHHRQRRKDPDPIPLA